MNTNQYTQKTLEALQAAQQLAVEYQHNALEPEHLLHALASQEQGLIPQLLQKLRDQALLLRSQGVQQMLRLQSVVLVLHSQLLGSLQSFQCFLRILIGIHRIDLHSYRKCYFSSLSDRLPFHF